MFDIAIITLCRAIYIVANLIPPRLLLFCCGAIGRSVGTRRKSEKAIALTQLAYVKRHLPNAESKERPHLRNASASSDINHLNSLRSIDTIKSYSSDEKLYADVFEHIGRAGGELLILKKLSRKSRQPTQTPNYGTTTFDYIDSVGQNEINELIARGKGAVALSGHLGCFELLAAFHTEAGLRVSVVGRLPKQKVPAIALNELRKTYGVEILWRDDPASGRKLLHALRNQKVIAALIDQDTDLDSEFSEFFGLPAACPITPIKIAIKQQIPIFTTFIVRTAPLRHLVISEEIPFDPSEPDCEQKILNIYARRLEDLVCRYPEQWLWWHRRWRRRPGVDYDKSPQLVPSTSEYLEWLRQLN